MLWDEEMRFLKSSLLGCSFKVLIRGVIFRGFFIIFLWREVCTSFACFRGVIAAGGMIRALQQSERAAGPKSVMSMENFIMTTCVLLW